MSDGCVTADPTEAPHEFLDKKRHKLTYTHIQKDIHTQRHTYIHYIQYNSYIDTYINRYIHAFIYTHIHTRKHRRIHTYIRAYKHTRTLTCRRDYVRNRSVCMVPKEINDFNIDLSPAAHKQGSTSMESLLCYAPNTADQPTGLQTDHE